MFRRRSSIREVYRLKKSHLFLKDDWLVTGHYDLRVSATRVLHCVRLRSRSAYPTVIHITEAYLRRHFTKIEDA